jgi:hypothetical protein
VCSDAGQSQNAAVGPTHVNPKVWLVQDVQDLVDRVKLRQCGPLHRRLRTVRPHCQDKTWRRREAFSGGQRSSQQGIMPAAPNSGTETRYRGMATENG